MEEMTCLQLLPMTFLMTQQTKMNMMRFLPKSQMTAGVSWFVDQHDCTMNQDSSHLTYPSQTRTELSWQWLPLSALFYGHGQLRL